jgi:predicted Fe-Mo cluster-binding NifX family protein
MNVAISATEDRMDSEVDPRFGRARWFAVIDTETNQPVFHDNTENLNASQGAGIQTSQMLAKLKVECIITGNIGPNAYTTLEAAGIDIYRIDGGTLQEALDKLAKGELKKSADSNVKGHWS